MVSSLKPMKSRNELFFCESCRYRGIGVPWGIRIAPGLYFLGLSRMHKLKSALLWGIGEDAEFNRSSVAPMSPNGTFGRIPIAIERRLSARKSRH